MGSSECPGGRAWRSCYREETSTSTSCADCPGTELPFLAGGPRREHGLFEPAVGRARSQPDREQRIGEVLARNDDRPPGLVDRRDAAPRLIRDRHPIAAVTALQEPFEPPHAFAQRRHLGTGIGFEGLAEAGGHLVLR